MLFAGEATVAWLFKRSVSLCGLVIVPNSINLIKAYFEVTAYLDKQDGTNLTQNVRSDLSKNSYPFLSIKRKLVTAPFLRYAQGLETEVGFGCIAYFHVY
jgi:hypothetical protein